MTLSEYGLYCLRAWKQYGASRDDLELRVRLGKLDNDEFEFIISQSKN